MTRNPLVGILLLLLAAWVYATDGAMSLPAWVRLPSIVSPVASQGVYVYEKDQGGVPPEVHAALNELNAKGIIGNAIDDDVTDGSGAIPDQYATAIPAAREAGLPALVVLSGQKVVRVVKSPATKEQVMDAFK